MLLKFFVLAVAVFSRSAYAQAQTQCRAVKEAGIRKFICSDGSVQKVSLLGGQIIIKTFNPETKSWSELRFPASDDMSLDTVKISIRQGG